MKKGKTCRSEQIFQSIQQGPLRPLLFFERGSYMYRPIVFIDMPAFMKAYQAIQKLKKPSAVSNRLFQSLKLEDQIYDEAALKVPRLKEVLRQKPRGLPIFPDIVRDLFQCFYSLKPVRRPENELSTAARSISAPLFAQFEKDTDYTRLQARCRGRSLLAAEGAAEFAEKLLQHSQSLVPKHGGQKDMAQVLEHQEQVFQKMLKVLNCKKQLYDKEPTDERFRTLSNQMNRALHKAKQLEDLRHILNDCISAAAHSRAQIVQQAAGAAEQHTQDLKMLLDAWGAEPGAEQPGEMDMEILKQTQSSDLLARVARYLGPCRELMHEQRNNGYTYRRGEKCGITLGAQVQQALSSELAYLAHPLTAPLFLHKMSCRQIRQYQRRERITLGSGDVIVCVDESASTKSDDKDAWARAIAYALVDKVVHRGRRASIIHFSSASEVSEDLFIPGRYTPGDIMNSARHFYCGGTDYEEPLRKAVETLDNGVLSKADIVFVTDGQCRISADFQDWLCGKLAEHRASITGILLDSGSSFEFSLKGFCKKIYRTSEIAPFEILSELVLS